MQGRIIVHLTSGELVGGVVHEFDAAEVTGTVEKLMQAEGQGSFVIDQGHEMYAIIPTRSIAYTVIEPWLGEEPK